MSSATAATPTPSRDVSQRVTTAEQPREPERGHQLCQLGGACPDRRRKIGRMSYSGMSVTVRIQKPPLSTFGPFEGM